MTARIIKILQLFIEHPSYHCFFFFFYSVDCTCSPYPICDVKYIQPHTPQIQIWLTFKQTKTFTPHKVTVVSPVVTRICVTFETSLYDDPSACVGHFLYFLVSRLNTDRKWSDNRVV